MRFGAWGLESRTCRVICCRKQDAGGMRLTVQTEALKESTENPIEQDPFSYTYEILYRTLLEPLLAPLQKEGRAPRGSSSSSSSPALGTGPSNEPDRLGTTRRGGEGPGTSCRRGSDQAPLSRGGSWVVIMGLSPTYYNATRTTREPPRMPLFEGLGRPGEDGVGFGA